MNGYLNYLIEVNMGLMLFLVAYILIFGRETDFKRQRIFLIVGIAASLIFPLFHIAYSRTTIPSIGHVLPTYLLPKVSIGGQGPYATGATDQKSIEIWFYIQCIYVVGVGFFLVRFIIQLLRLVMMMRTSTFSAGRYRIVESSAHQHTFSFFNFIFLGSADTLSPDEKQKIIQHETVHARQNHSIDILLLNLLKILFWFNPAINIYKKIFIQLHEFEADARAVENRDVDAYCCLLAKVALQSAELQLANHFNHSLTIKRIEMMKSIKRKLRTWKVVVFASVVPIAFFILAGQDQLLTEVKSLTNSSIGVSDIPDEVQRKIDELNNAKPAKKFVVIETTTEEGKNTFENVKEDQIANMHWITPTAKPSEPIRTFLIIVLKGLNGDGDVFTSVEKPASPVGGMEEFYKYLMHNIKYPKEARMKGIEGDVLVEFIVNTDGAIEVTGISGIDTDCDLEAMLVVQSSPKWIPAENQGVAVKQKMVLPVGFRLTDPDMHGEVNRKNVQDKLMPVAAEWENAANGSSNIAKALPEGSIQALWVMGNRR